MRPHGKIAHSVFVLLQALASLHVAQAAGDDGSTVAVSPPARPKADWALQVSQTVVYTDDPILLVMHSARDCAWCARWKGSLGGKHEFESWAKSHPSVHLFIVERNFISDMEKGDDYPPEVRWIFDRVRQHGNPKMGTPTFEIYVRQRIVWRSYGYYSWDRNVFPVIKDLDSRRLLSTEPAQ